MKVYLDNPVCYVYLYPDTLMVGKQRIPTRRWWRNGNCDTVMVCLTRKLATRGLFWRPMDTPTTASKGNLPGSRHQAGPTSKFYKAWFKKQINTNKQTAVLILINHSCLDGCCGLINLDVIEMHYIKFKNKTKQKQNKKQHVVLSVYFTLFSLNQNNDIYI